MKRNNVVIKDKSSVFIDDKVKLGENVIIYENNRIEGNTFIGDNVTIYPNNYIVNSVIGKGAKLYSSHIENSEVGVCASVGPFAHLRSGAKIRGHVRIGNFCEVKNAEIGAHSKLAHLAYVGDAKVGKNCNIGCGVIFVNYNGKVKQKTFVGDGVFIGSNVNIIAPVTIGDGAYICAGTTITKNIDAGDFVIGRAREEIKPNRANNYFGGALDESEHDKKTKSESFSWGFCVFNKNLGDRLLSPFFVFIKKQIVDFGTIGFMDAS